jgi:hypothetical protein
MIRKPFVKSQMREGNRGSGLDQIAIDAQQA